MFGVLNVLYAKVANDKYLATSDLGWSGVSLNH